MATVYVLTGVIEYEASEVLGAYESQEAAEAARDEYRERCVTGTDWEYDSYEVTSMELGAAAGHRTRWLD